jgi:phosphatidate cytidylyltransferase
MGIELKKRILTSFVLFIMFIFMMLNQLFLLYALIIISIISWLEFSSLVSKIFKKKYFQLIFNLLFLTYISLYSIILFILFINFSTKLLIILTILICIATDIGGLTFGKIFKGKKLTSISPNKTISGALGSFIFSILILIIFYFAGIIEMNLKILVFFLMTSLFSQLGDIFISFLKRNAKVKNTGNLLPGHGGLLDRVDGILLGVPAGIFTFFLLI